MDTLGVVWANSPQSHRLRDSEAFKNCSITARGIGYLLTFVQDLLATEFSLRRTAVAYIQRVVLEDQSPGGR